MDVTSTVEDLKEHLSEWQIAGDHVALVATSGSLHDGHLSLVEIAREHAERVVVSIFRQPSQSDGSELPGDAAPSLERDQRRLKRAKVDLVFAPDLETLYPFGTENATTVSVPVLSDDIFGNARPGGFDSVTTVISRLFALMQPDVAVFGQKDFQQQLVIRRMTEDMNLPIRIVSAPICREDDGLAMSSVNQSLTDAERRVAAKLYENLKDIAQSLSSGRRDLEVLETMAIDDLAAAGFVPEYVSIRRAENLEVPDRDCDELVVLGAARLGEARLSDNIVVHV